MKSIGKINTLNKNIMPDMVIVENINEEADGQRIDNFFFKRFKRVPKSHIYQLLRSGQVRVNSKRINADYRLQQNDKVRIPPIRTFQSAQKIIKPPLAAFEVLFEDEWLLAINKPSGIAVHGGSGISYGVIEQLRAHHSDWKFLELVHRLDRETSGVLLLAKKRSALVEAHRQIREGIVQKRYSVMVKGRWRNAKQSVKLSLNKFVTADGERRVMVMSGKNEEKKELPAHTVFTLKKNWQNFSLLEAELKTGRTHQIRVHLAHLGFPIVGDDKYGDFELNKKLMKGKQRLALKRMFLHAASLKMTHPATGEYIGLEAALPNDLTTFLQRLDEENPVTRP
ncbi:MULTISPECIES: RluA family pseudouridine synthase [Nitrosomonas]|uniref:Pseudouridine synthase n=1 Tax=Nitrosomonas communis TaxID=44574 RepID=A0A0F7KIB8_9PROT|nr:MULTISPECIES: RluA family pseudouridine synthase [Nitrosomonas]AKH38609.1 pseudouridine synthase [Nitrosomonas communis]TYP93085.1 23S rRNA pseudouridine955/2504/2580 synthase [Nitrosomonas communis]UVS60674.1 RluA family pseudouridine synthase [Nitrosomonas sp. PLL12]